MQSSGKHFQKPFLQREYDFHNKYKTELCKTYAMNGYCKYGAKCRFAHGKEELQSKKHLHRMSKTKPCHGYHFFGVCKYGIRCQFLHDEITVDRSAFFRNSELKVQHSKAQPIADFSSNERAVYFKEFKTRGIHATEARRYTKQLEQLGSIFADLCFGDLKQAFRISKANSKTKNRLDCFSELTAPKNFYHCSVCSDVVSTASNSVN